MHLCARLGVLLSLVLSSIASDAHAEQDEPWKLIYANLEPDRLEQSSDANIQPLLNGPGAHLRVIVSHVGSDADHVSDVLINGVSLNETLLKGRSHPQVQQFPFYKQHSIEFVDGGAPKPLVDAGRPLWCRILPSGTRESRWTEVVVRMRTWADQRINVQLVMGSGFKMSVPVRTDDSQSPKLLTQFTHIGLATFNRQLNQLYVYVLTPQASVSNPVSIKTVRLDEQDVTASCQSLKGYSTTGVVPFTVNLKAGWKKGSFHLLDCTLSTGERRVCSVRAFNGFSTAMFGANFGGPRPFIEKGFEEFYQHYIDSWIAPGGTDAWRQICEDWWQQMAGELGIRLQPNHHHAGQTSDEVRELATSDKQTFAYWLFDEPDINDYGDGAAHGIPLTLRLGIHAQRLVKLSETLRSADPEHPTTFVVDSTFRPQNYPTYGQVGDLMQADIYYALAATAKFTPWDPLPFMYGSSRSARDAFMPKPMHIVVSASPDGGARPPTPEEERISVYASIAAGANGICYYWYNANKEAGCQWVVDTWAEIAVLNRQMQLLAPWIGVGFPVHLPTKSDEQLWVKTTAAGTDSILVIVVNQQYMASPEGFSGTPIDDASVHLEIPEGFKVTSAVSIEDAGPTSIKAAQDTTGVTLRLGSIDVGKLILLSRKAGNLKQLKMRWQDLER